MSNNDKLLLTLNLVALLIIGLAGWIILRLLFWLRPYDTALASGAVSINSLLGGVILVIALLALTALHVVIHEAIHGIFFWWFTRARPTFAFRWTYAYAAAPDWYIPRLQFLVTTLAPLVLLTLLGLAVLLIAPPAWLMPVLFVVIMNVGGAVGDMLVAYRLVRMPRTCFVQDRGDAVTFFTEA